MKTLAPLGTAQLLLVLDVVGGVSRELCAHYTQLLMLHTSHPSPRHQLDPHQTHCQHSWGGLYTVHTPCKKSTQSRHCQHSWGGLYTKHTPCKKSSTGTQSKQTLPAFMGGIIYCTMYILTVRKVLKADPCSAWGLPSPCRISTVLVQLGITLSL